MVKMFPPLSSLILLFFLLLCLPPGIPELPIRYLFDSVSAASLQQHLQAKIPGIFGCLQPEDAGECFFILLIRRAEYTAASAAMPKSAGRE